MVTLFFRIVCGLMYSHLFHVFACMTCSYLAFDWFLPTAGVPCYVYPTGTLHTIESKSISTTTHVGRTNGYMLCSLFIIALIIYLCILKTKTFTCYITLLLYQFQITTVYTKGNVDIDISEHNGGAQCLLTEILITKPP